MRYAFFLLALLSCESKFSGVDYTSKICIDHQGPSDAWQIGIEIMVNSSDTTSISNRVNPHDRLVINVDSATFFKVFNYVESKESEFHYDPSLIGISVSILTIEDKISVKYSLVTPSILEKFLGQLIKEIESEKTKELVEAIEQLFLSL